MKEIFITATDTDAGKTFVSCALIHALTHHVIASKKNTVAQNKVKVAAFKPISAGCDLIDGQLINEDANLLSEVANCQQSISEINPIAFKDPIAPHIAAKKQKQVISVSEISQFYKKTKSLPVDFTLVEGAGGWRLPLGPQSIHDDSNYAFLSDFVKAEQLKVILIVHMKLGCLNHALLTYQAIKADGLDCIAWIANCASNQPMNNLTENIAELTKLLPIPKIAQLGFFADTNAQGESLTFANKISLAAREIDLTPLL